MTLSNTDAVVSDIARPYLKLQLTADVGPIRLRNLIAHFGSAEAVLGASIRELERVEGIGPRIAESIFQSRDRTGSGGRTSHYLYGGYGLPAAVAEHP